MLYGPCVSPSGVPSGVRPQVASVCGPKWLCPSGCAQVAVSPPQVAVPVPKWPPSLVSQQETHAWERSGQGAKSGWLSPIEIDEANDPIGADLCGKSIKGSWNLILAHGTKTTAFATS